MMKEKSNSLLHIKIDGLLENMFLRISQENMILFWPDTTSTEKLKRDSKDFPEEG